MEIEKYVNSKDGTRIGYRQIGNGEGLIIVHGSGRISENYRNLAGKLAQKFTVYTIDRRGRGLSGDWTTNHSIKTEVEDLTALVAATQAKFIFGHSFGGVISLQAAMPCNIQRLAVYEPPISINNSIPFSWLPEFEKALSRNEKVKAMAIFLNALPPPNISKFPKVAYMLLGYVVKFLERKKANQVKMLNLLYTIPPDLKIVKSLDFNVNTYKSMSVKTLLMSGTGSQIFFQKSVEALGEVLPNAQTEIFEGFDHYSPEERVEQIATSLVNFLVE
ncbi:alpha/beta fold hydrolase [Mucilaginibacter sp. 3215]|uniref:alpha/beta fold hydrolase n=1 Tax=Mucilaginibacter sp. 3215 TaxID=3373912 RepID=UPI003D1D7979